MDEAAQQRLLRRALQPGDDSGIDSDDSAGQRRRAQRDLVMREQSDTSSDEEMVMDSPMHKWAKRRYDDRMLDESGSSDEDLVLRSPKAKWAKCLYYEHLENRENARERKRNREALIPMLVQGQPRRDSGTVSPASPARSTSPLFEVELTASDEEEDGSVLELVIPLQSPRYNKVSAAAPQI